MFVLMCIGMGAVSIVMGVINYRNEGTQYKKNIVKRENDYNRYIAGQEEKIQELREKERIISRQKYPSLEEELSYVEDFDARLFEKQKTHEDYLYVRLGEGIVPSQCTISFKEQEYREVDDPLMDYPAKLHEKYAYIEKMNPYCSKRIFLNKNEYTGYVQDIMDGEQIQHFCYSRVPIEKAEQAALKMACVYVDEVSLEASLTKNITLYQLLGIMNVYDLDLTQRWNNSKIYNTMAAPLGVKSGDEIVYLDLHEKYHGPHGLVAGTTGSGKSEILQSYILSMATLFHPYEVGFIIIDFKGGGMVNQFRNLPHLNGAITNIDGKEINRSLSSIKAELKSEQPEFMKELISAARIGRSLGVHLILATQKPSGVVNEQIWSNSKFKLCLKVQNQSDSNEVIKSPLAAEIREPGRAYLQVGNNEIFQLFQSAYSGAPVPNGAMGEAKKFRISKVDLSGRREVIFEQKPTEEKGGDTQLDAIVDYVEEYCKRNHIERLPDICLPPLPEVIPYTMEGYENTGTDICVPIGMYDDPEQQYQGIMDVNFSQGHVFIVGSSQMGKTNMLQNMIRGIAGSYSSNHVQIYLLDFASMILKNFEELKHVGDVITSTEEEKIKNFFKMMEQELVMRKDMLSDMGLSSYSSYLESGQREISQIVIMLDNIGAFRELFPALDDKMVKLVREGAAVGISVVVTAQQSAGLGYRYLSNFSKRFALYCNDSGEYSSVFERCRTSLNSIPGRCLLSMNKSLYEGQVYIAFPAEKEIDKVKEIRAFIKETNQKDSGCGAAKTPVVPTKVTREMLHNMMGGVRNPYAVPLGVNYENMEVDTMNLQNFQIFGVSGDDELGRKAFIINMIQELLEDQNRAPVNIYIFDGKNQELQSLEKQVVYYTTTPDDIKSRLKDLFKLLEKRRGSNLIQEPLELFIINDEAVYDFIGNDTELFQLCQKSLIEYSECKFSLALTNVPNVNLQFKATPFVKILKEANNLILFKQIQDLKLFDPDVRMRNKYHKPLVQNEMYFKCGDYFGKYKTPEC